jgi:hypothetical protein
MAQRRRGDKIMTSDVFQGAGQRSVAIGGAVVYRGSNHLTNTFAVTPASIIANVSIRPSRPAPIADAALAAMPPR